MICSSGVGFDPASGLGADADSAGGGERLTFGFHGIWQGVAVLYDKQTRSLWLHLTGECIDGKLAGRQLDLVSGRHTLWGEWRRDHPDSEVMAENTLFSSDYFPEVAARRGLDFFPQGFEKTIDARDERLAPSALLYGVTHEGEQRAYPFATLLEVPGGVVNDRVGDLSVAIFFSRDTRSAVGYGRRVGERLLKFTRADDETLVDTTTNSQFDLAGRCIDGPLQGQQLPRIGGLQAEWYGWYATYPETTLFEAQPPAD